MAKHYRFGSGIKVVTFSSERQKRAFMGSFTRPSEKSPYQITLGEKELMKLSRQEKKRLPGRVSYLSFFGGFIHSLKVKDFLALNKKNGNDEKVMKILKDYQLEGLLNTKFYRLKEEERKRVLLAQATLSFYDILFVDDSLLEKYGVSFIDGMMKLVSSDKLVFLFTEKKENMEGYGYPLIDLDQEEYTDSSIRMISDSDTYPGIGYRSLFGTLSDKRFRLRWLLIPLFVLSTLTVAVFSAGMRDSSNVYSRTYEESQDEVIALENHYAFEDIDVKKLNEKTGTTFYRAVMLRFNAWLHPYFYNQSSEDPFWPSKFEQYSLIGMCFDNKAPLPDYLSLVAGTLPNNDDEIMLTDYQLQFYKKNGMLGFNGQSSLTAEEITSDVSCVVGHYIQDVIIPSKSEYEFEKVIVKIAGVLNTGYQESEFKDYLDTEKDKDLTEEEAKLKERYDFMTYYSFYNAYYVSRNIYNKMLEYEYTYLDDEKKNLSDTTVLIGKTPTSKSAIKYLGKIDQRVRGVSVQNPFAKKADRLIDEKSMGWYLLYGYGIALILLCAILWIVFFCFYFNYVGMGWNYLRNNKYSLTKLCLYPILLALIPMVLGLLIGAPLGVSTIAIFNRFVSKPYFSYGLTEVLWALLSSVSIYFFSLMIAWIISLRKLKD